MSGRGRSGGPSVRRPSTTLFHMMEKGTAMNYHLLQILLVGILALPLGSCSGKPEFSKERYPVRGEVYVDGEPAARLSVILNDVKGFDQQAPAIPQAVTRQDGTFAISTFEAEDGAPAGEYKATFVWGRAQGLGIDTSVDQLKGKYSDPKKSEFKVTVNEGEPIDMGRIELTSK